MAKAVTVIRDGENLWPTPIPPAPTPAAKPASSAASASASATPQTAEEKAASQAETAWASAVRRAGATSVGLGGVVALGLAGPTPAAAGMLTKFALAGLAGYQSVWSVKPALHSPLMCVVGLFLFSPFPPPFFSSSPPTLTLLFLFTGR